MLQPVRVLAVAAVLRPARRLHVSRVPRLRPERAQRRRRMEGAGADLHVVGLQDDAAPSPPNSAAAPGSAPGTSVPGAYRAASRPFGCSHRARCWWMAGEVKSAGQRLPLGLYRRHMLITWVQYAGPVRYLIPDARVNKGRKCAQNCSHVIAAVAALSPWQAAAIRRRRFPVPAGPHRDRLPARRPDRFRRPPRRRQDEGQLGQTRHHRQQARRQRHARRRLCRQVRSRWLHAVPHHGRRGDGVAAYHARHAATTAEGFRAGRAGHHGDRSDGGHAEVSASRRRRTWSRLPRRSPAPFRSPRPASARRRIWRRNCSRHRLA